MSPPKAMIAASSSLPSFASRPLTEPVLGIDGHQRRRIGASPA